MTKPISFAGLEIAPGPLYYNGSSYEIKDSWNYDSYRSKYGKTAGSTYFSFIQLGQLFESASFSSSSGNIENILDPFDGWRLPTWNEWGSIIGTSRAGSTVNGTTRKHYSLVQLTGVSHVGVSEPRGLIIFPDKCTITGKSLQYMDDDDVSAGVTASQLNVYLEQGCAFLPCSDYCERSSRWGGRSGRYGRYWSSTSKSAGAAYSIHFFEGTVYMQYQDHWTDMYLPVRLVREV